MGHPRSNWGVPTVLRSAHCRHTPIHGVHLQWRLFLTTMSKMIELLTDAGALQFDLGYSVFFQTLVLDLHIFQFLKSFMEDQNHFQQEMIHFNLSAEKPIP